MDSNSLPPLPGSDEGSLESWRKDSYYDVRARDFWQGNKITRIEDKPYEKCDHDFKHIPSGVECQRCHFGLVGQLEIQNGKLFHKGEPLGI